MDFGEMTAHHTHHCVFREHDDTVAETSMTAHAHGPEDTELPPSTVIRGAHARTSFT